MSGRARARLAAEVLAAYVRVRWLVLRRGSTHAAPILRGGLEQSVGAGPDEARTERALRLGHAVMKVLRVLPADSRCLMRSLVLTRLLARRGVYATVVIGVRSAPSFAAHAWVEVDHTPVLPTDESVYQRLVEM